MTRTPRMGLALVAIVLLGACGRPDAVPPTHEGLVEGNLVLPPGFTNGTPFTQSTPFTNSIPLAPSQVIAAQAKAALTGPQTVEAVDPATGRVVASTRSGADGRFVLSLPGSSEPVVLQVVVKDAWGRIFGLVATTARPAAREALTLSAGTTVAPVAGALSVGEGAGITFGAGFTGIPRPRLARALGKLEPAVTAKAGERFDAQFEEAESGSALMTLVARTADRLAAQVLDGTAQDPETIGTRLGTALTMEGEAPAPPTPPPTPTVSPSPRPRPTPWRGDGHSPAMPAPWPPRR